MSLYDNKDIIYLEKKVKRLFATLEPNVMYDQYATVVQQWGLKGGSDKRDYDYKSRYILDKR